MVNLPALIKCPEGYKGEQCAYIPAGAFNRKEIEKEIDDKPAPARSVYVSAFYLDPFRATCGAWREFMASGIKAYKVETQSCDKDRPLYSEKIGFDPDQLLRDLRVENANKGKTICKTNTEDVTDRFITIPLPDTGQDHLAITNVSWYGAMLYCQWKGGRLLTEMEWEKAVIYASRGKVDVNMADRTYEWVSDWRWDQANSWLENDKYIRPSRDPRGPKDGQNRVMKAASGKGDAFFVYSRGWYAPSYSSLGNNNVAFRCGYSE